MTHIYIKKQSKYFFSLPDISDDKPQEAPLPPKEPEKVQQLIPPQQEVPSTDDTAECESVGPEKQQPMAPPRKSNGTPAKRRAPAPPPTSAPLQGPTPATTETAADVHRADEQVVVVSDWVGDDDVDLNLIVSVYKLS